MKPAIVNVCTPAYCSNVNCSSAESDMLPAQNLLKNSSETGSGSSQEGFMTEPYIRSPVTLTFSFAAAIKRLLAIDIGLEVANQRTEGLEIYTTPFSDVNLNVTVSKKVGGSYKIHPNTKQIKFLDRNCQHFHDLPELDKSGTQTLFFSNTFYLRNIVNVSLKITRARSVPCLNFVKLWSFDYQKANNLAPKESAKVPLMPAVHESKDTTIISTGTIDQNLPLYYGSDTDKLPNDFLDPLTCEALSLPVILPCGKTVDRSTLERYNEEEAKCGRPPSDPYTGVPFSTLQHPVADVALKSRIDMFWAKNPELAKKLNPGRTVGGGHYAVTSGAGNNVNHPEKTPQNLKRPAEYVLASRPFKLTKTSNSSADTLSTQICKALDGKPSYV